MNIYVVLIHDWEENEHYIIGTYSNSEKAISAMDAYMATEHGQNEFTDWDYDYPAGNWLYFYEGFTGEIQRTRLDEETES